MAFGIRFSAPVPKVYEQNLTESCGGKTVCSFTMNIPEDMEGPVFWYIKFEKFYLHHRKVVNSVSKSQLAGRETTTPDLDSKCGNKLKNKDMERGTVSELGGSLDSEAYASPCGLYANLMPIGNFFD